MSRRDRIFIALYGFVTLWGIVLLFIATSTPARVAGIAIILSGLLSLVATIVERRRRRRRDAAPVVHDPRTPTE